MSEQELINKINSLHQYLELIHLYNDEFVEKYGQKGGEEEIDRILDSINFYNQKLDILRKKKERE